jgi:hypothetical protein
MNLSKHFTLAEMTRSLTASRKGIDNTPGPQEIQNLIDLCENVLEPLRKYLGQPLPISSGYRSPDLNKAIGGASRNGKQTSQHCYGQAVDIVVEGRNAEIFRYLKNLDVDQVIWEFGTDQEPAWIHVSYNKGKNRNNYLKAVKRNGKTQYIKL